MTIRDLLILTLLASLWGGSFLFIKLAVGEISPPVIVFLRMAIASVCLLPFALMRGNIRDNLSLLPHFLVVGTANSLAPFLMIALALVTLNVGVASIIQGIIPLLSVLLAWVWLKEPLGKRAIAGLPLGLAGVVILAWGDLSFNPQHEGFAVLLAIGSVFSYSFAAVYAKRFLPRSDPFATTSFSLGIGALLLLPWLGPYWPEQLPSVTAWLSVLGLSLGSTAFAYILFYHMINKIGPGRASTVAFLIPGFGVLWGVLFLNETLNLRTIVAFAIILAGMVLTTDVLKSFRK